MTAAEKLGKMQLEYDKLRGFWIVLLKEVTDWHEKTHILPVPQPLGENGMTLTVGGRDVFVKFSVLKNHGVLTYGFIAPSLNQSEKIEEITKVQYFDELGNVKEDISHKVSFQNIENYADYESFFFSNILDALTLFQVMELQLHPKTD